MIGLIISEKNGITYSINHNLARIRIDSYNSLPIEKKQSFHNCYYNIFLEKGLYEDKSNTQYF